MTLPISLSEEQGLDGGDDDARNSQTLAVRVAGVSRRSKAQLDGRAERSQLDVMGWVIEGVVRGKGSCVEIRKSE